MNIETKSNHVFDKEFFNHISTDKCEYLIGIDTYDKYVSAYSLCRIINGKIEILLVKSITDKKEFKEQVKNLSKYFSAEIIK